MAIFSVIAFYFWRDLRLGLNVSDLNIPDVVVENIEISRVIDGSEWNLVSPRAEHRQGMIYGQSVDITVIAGNGDVSQLFAVSGVFSRTSGDVVLNDVSADVRRENKTIFLRSGRAYYDSVAEKWYFSNDVTINDGSVEASGPEGVYDVKQGLSTITGGGTVKWLQ